MSYKKRLFHKLKSKISENSEFFTNKIKILYTYTHKIEQKKSNTEKFNEWDEECYRKH